MIDLGAQYPVAVDIYDENGALTNAGTFTLVITLPDGSTVTPDVSNPPDAEGQYRYAYPTVQAGRHVVRVTTDNPVTAYTDVFDVGVAGIASILSLADAKTRLGIDLSDTTDDDELRAKLTGLTGAIERYKNEVIARRSFTETGMLRRGQRLRLWRVPVISLDTLTGETAAGVTTYDVTGFRVDPESGLVHRMSGPAPFGWVTAGTTAGYTVIPPDYLEAAGVLLEHLWETRRGPGTVGAGVIGAEEAGDWKQMTMLPRKVTEWLGKPRPVVA